MKRIFKRRVLLEKKSDMLLIRILPSALTEECWYSEETMMCRLFLVKQSEFSGSYVIINRQHYRGISNKFLIKEHCEII